MEVDTTRERKGNSYESPSSKDNAIIIGFRIYNGLRDQASCYM